jgi:methyl-accepting chemotaxis protein
MRFSVRQKLLAGFGAVLVLMLLVGVLAISALSGVANRSDQAYTRSTVPLGTLGKATTQISRNRATVLRHMLSRTPEAKDQQEATLAEGRAALDRLLREAEPTFVTAEGKALLGEARKVLKEFRGVIDSQILPLSRRDSAAAFELNKKIGAPRGDAAEAAVTALATHKIRNAAALNGAVADAYSSSKTQTIILLLLGCAIAIGIALFLARGIVGAVQQVLRAAQGIAEGDVEQSVDVKSKDEFGSMATAFVGMVAYLKNIAGAAERVADGDLTTQVEPKSERDVLGRAFVKMTENLRHLVGRVGDTAHSLSSSSEQMASTSEQTGRAVGEIASAVGEVALGAQRQVESIEQARRLTDEVVEATGASSAEATETAKAADEARRVAGEGEAAIVEATGAMTAVRAASSDATEAIRKLGETSAQIGSIVDTITSISEQTNLLALNAAIEAARAGEQGRGFAVVAEEVRKLAEESSTAASSISALIRDIQNETARAVDVVEEGGRRTDSGAATVEQARAAFEAIGTSVEDMTARIGRIAAAAEQVSSSSQAIAERMADVASVAEESSASTEQVSASTQETSASTQEVAASAQELSATAQELQALVATFRVTA